MRTSRNGVNRMIAAAAILVCILLPVCGIATDPSVNEQLLQAAENDSVEQIKTLLAQAET